MRSEVRDVHGPVTLRWRPHIAVERAARSTEDFIDAGVALVPSRRLDEGLAAEMSVTETLRCRGRASRETAFTSATPGRTTKPKR